MAPGFSEFIRSRRDRIVGRFVERLYDGLAANALPPQDVANSIGKFLDELADALDDHALLPGDRSPGSVVAAKLHGRQRFHLGYDVATVIREYGALRDLLFDEAAEAGVVPSNDEARVLSSQLFGAVADAAEQYGKERDQVVEAQAARHLAFLAHELRNPLSSMGLAFVALKDTGLLPESHPSVGVIDRGLRSLARLIDDALVETSMERGGGPSVAPLEVAKLVDAVVQEAAPYAEHKKIALVVSCEAETCKADERYLHSALSNLVRNAVKFSKTGGTVRVAARSADGRVVFEVEDECGGIAQADVEKLFDPFVQRGTDRTGFGLGLSIAKQATDAHHGSLRVHTVAGRGCVFVIDLPEAGPSLV